MFIDYRKAFDSVEYNAVWQAIQSQGVHSQLSLIVQEMYKEGLSKIKMKDSMVPVKIERGVRQGDTLSPLLFTALLRSVFLNLDWENRGISINGDRLSNLQFADDIVLFANTRDELREMAEELCDQSKKVGLLINASKTVAMSNQVNVAPIQLTGEVINFVDQFKYLGQTIEIPLNQNIEIRKRIQTAWSVFYTHRSFLTCSNVQMELKRKLFNMCVLPAFLYGAESWALRQKERKILAVAQRKMERRMADVSLLDRKTNEWLRNVTKLRDVVVESASRKWKWARKISSFPIERWSRRVAEWNIFHRRDPGRPRRRWRDELVQAYGPNWMNAASDQNNMQQWKVSESMSK